MRRGEAQGLLKPERVLLAATRRGPGIHTVQTLGERECLSDWLIQGQCYAVKALALGACHTWLLPISQGSRGALPPDTHLEAGDSETSGIIRQGSHGHHKGAIWDVLIVELDGDLIVTWGGEASQRRPQNRQQGRSHPNLIQDRLLGQGSALETDTHSQGYGVEGD